MSAPMADRTEATLAAMTQAIAGPGLTGAPFRATLARARPHAERALRALPADVIAVLRGEMVAVRPEVLEAIGRGRRR